MLKNVLKTVSCKQSCQLKYFEMKVSTSASWGKTSTGLARTVLVRVGWAMFSENRKLVSLSKINYPSMKLSVFSYRLPLFSPVLFSLSFMMDWDGEVSSESAGKSALHSDLIKELVRRSANATEKSDRLREEEETERARNRLTDGPSSARGLCQDL